MGSVGRNKRWTVASWAIGSALLGGALVLRKGYKRYSLRGKVVLITGGSRGLGLELAREFVRQGARVAITARDQDALDRAREELRARGADVLAVPCDVTDVPSAHRLLETVRESLGPIDVLVNNAGVISVGPMEEMTLTDYEHAMNLHFWAPLHLSLGVVPHMQAQKSGRIVNISSIGGVVAVPHLLPYSASKFALTGLSEGMRAELAKDGVVVTTVCPGLMRTGSPRHGLFKGRNQAEYAWFNTADALPPLAMDSRRAARRIVRACRHGESRVVLTVVAKIAALVHGVFPGVVMRILGVVNRALPAPVGTGTPAVPGSESQSAKVPRWLTALSDRAAVRNNEVAPAR